MVCISQHYSCISFVKLFSKTLNDGHYGGITHELFRSDLCNRKQKVEDHDTSGYEIISEWQTITCCVTQGSILVPLVFLIYINDFPNNLKPTKSILYADDTSIIITGTDTEKLKQDGSATTWTPIIHFLRNKK